MALRFLNVQEICIVSLTTAVICCRENWPSYSFRGNNSCVYWLLPSRNTKLCYPLNVIKRQLP